MNNELEPKKVYARALDPIHIGAGGYRLGRVDNTIVRDPATDVPKIPGTSIAGVIRTFAEIVKEDDKNKDVNEIIRVVSPYLKNLGIGGMGTRGFGRLEIVQIKEKGQQEVEANAQP